MPILKLTDTESINADQLKQLISQLLLHPETNIGTPLYENNGTRINLRQTIEVVFDPDIRDQVEEILSNSENRDFLTHKVRIHTPFVDDEENVFNYNNYESDAFSYYNLRFEDYENYSKTAEEKSLPNFLIGALYDRSSVSDREQFRYYTMFESIESLYNTKLLLPATPINNFEFDGKYNGEDFALAEKIDYFKVFYDNRLTSSIEYTERNQHVYVDYDYNLNDSTQIGNCPFYNRIRLPSKQNSIPNVLTPLLPVDRIVDGFEASRATEFLLKTFRRSDSFTRDFSDANGNVIGLKVYDLFDELESFGITSQVKESDELYLRTKDTIHLSETNNPFLFL